MSFLGVDVGTSSVKVGVLNLNGTWTAKAAVVPGANDALQTGSVDPDQWWTATLQALQALAKEISLQDVEAVAAIGNTPTLILVDKAGRAVYPALLWSDTRADREASELREERSQSEWNAIYGGYIPVSAAYPSAKLRWLSRHQPQALSRTVKILQPKDFVNYHLTGVMASDRWSSKGLVSLNISDGAAPLEAIGLDPTLAPACYRPIDVIGEVTAAAAERTGLRRGIPVMAGWSDTLGAVVSLGLGDRDGFVLSGTSESIGIMTRNRVKSQAVLCAPVWDSGFNIVYGPTSTGLSTINWAGSVLGGSLNQFENSQALAPDLAIPIFVPFLLGQRSPYWDDTVRGAWLNVGINTSREQLWDAVHEGVVAAERDVLEAVVHATGSVCSQLVVTGGGSRVSRLNEWRSAIFDCPVFEVGTDPVLGASLLAQWGARPATMLQGAKGVSRWKLHPRNFVAPKRYDAYRQAVNAVLSYTTEVTARD